MVQYILANDKWRMEETQDDEFNHPVFFTNAPEWEIEEFYQDSCTVNSNSHSLKIRGMLTKSFFSIIISLNSQR